MIAFILVIFTLATLRTIIPLAKRENVTIGNIIFAVTHIVALIELYKQFITIK